MNKTAINTQKRDDKCRKVAESMGCSVRYVRMVREGKKTNETILAALFDLCEAENKVLEEVKKIAPFTSKSTREGRRTNQKSTENDL